MLFQLNDLPIVVGKASYLISTHVEDTFLVSWYLENSQDTR